MYQIISDVVIFLFKVLGFGVLAFFGFFLIYYTLLRVIIYVHRDRQRYKNNENTKL